MLLTIYSSSTNEQDEAAHRTQHKFLEDAAAVLLDNMEWQKQNGTVLPASLFTEFISLTRTKSARYTVRKLNFTGMRIKQSEIICIYIYIYMHAVHVRLKFWPEGLTAHSVICIGLIYLR